MLDANRIPRVRAISTRTSVLVVAFLALLCFAALATPVHAFQTGRTTSLNSVASTGSLEGLIDIHPGTALQPGTSTPIASGLDLTFAINLGRVPDARTFPDAFRITNHSSTAHTIRVTTTGAGLGSIASVGFSADSDPGDGAGTETIQPGATELMFIATTTATAGSGSGNLRFERVGDERFYRRDRPIQTIQAPAAPTGLAAVSNASPNRVDLNWSAPPSTGYSGFNVYRSTSAAGTYTKLNASPIAATSYTDTSAVPGSRYWYRVRAVTSGIVPEQEGAISNTVTSRIPPTPVSVIVPAGGSNPAGFINFATRGSATVRVAVPAATEASDVLHVEIANGATSVSATSTVNVAGAQTVNVTGINATAVAEGSVVLRAWLTKPNETGGVVTGTATKDTLAEVSGAYVAATAVNPVNFINIATGVSPGTSTGAVSLPASSATTDTVSLRYTMGASTTTLTAGGLAGTGVRTIAGFNTNGWAQGTVAVAARVQDAAGNDSGWIVGTPATRDTVAPPTPTAARILVGATHPANMINIANAAAVPVTVAANGAVSSVEVRLIRSGVTVTGAASGTGTVVVPVNATTLADGGPGTVDVSARQLDAAWNPSAWFNGTDAAKDTVPPNPPNFTRITLRDLPWFLPDFLSGANGALGSQDELRIHDYDNGATVPANGWDVANNNGGFGTNLIASDTLPRTFGYDIRDSAWNQIPRICRVYNASGSGAPTTCP